MMAFRRFPHSTDLYTCLVVGMLLILSGCGVREAMTGMVQPADQVPEEAEMVTTPGAYNDSVNPVSISTVTPQITPTPTFDIYREYGRWEEITHFREELQRTDLSEEDREFYERNLAAAEYSAEVRATAKAGPTAVRRGPPAAVQEVRPTPVRGIDNTFNGIKGIRIANVWRGPVDGIWFNIHAGSLEDDRSQGLLYFWAVDVMEAPLAIYQTPTKAGIVKVIAEQNQQLTLEAEDGTLFVFDIPSRTYVDNSLAVTPTPTAATE